MENLNKILSNLEVLTKSNTIEWNNCGIIMYTNCGGYVFEIVPTAFRIDGFLHDDPALGENLTNLYDLAKSQNVQRTLTNIDKICENIFMKEQAE